MENFIKFVNDYCWTAVDVTIEYSKSTIGFCMREASVEVIPNANIITISNEDNEINLADIKSIWEDGNKFEIVNGDWHVVVAFL